MSERNFPARQIAIPALYGCGVVFSVHFGRFSGGVAMVWIGSAMLAAGLCATRRADWPRLLIASVAINALVTGLIGLGWAVAVPLAIINVAEAVGAALAVRWLLRQCWPDDPLELTAMAYLMLGVCLPLATAVPGVAVASALAGIPFEQNFFHWVLGHAVGLIAVLPLSLVLARKVRTGAPMVPRGQAVSAVLLAATMALLAFGVFNETWRPLMLLPLVFMVYVAVWSSLTMALAMPVIVALVGAPLTVLGHGPLGGLAIDQGDRVQLFQLYVALAVVCTLPVATEHERRRRQLRRLSRSEAEWRAHSARVSQRIAELELAAATDSLTGLPNRRAFLERLAQVTASGRPACLAILDIDHFKQINDRYGHIAGDAVLSAFGALAASAVRCTDMVARIGGEEFAVLLPDTTLEQGELVCDRLMRRAAETALATAAGPVRITISTGVAQLDSDGTAAMAAADRALYRAKESGRARLQVAA